MAPYKAIWCALSVIVTSSITSASILASSDAEYQKLLARCRWRETSIGNDVLGCLETELIYSMDQLISAREIPISTDITLVRTISNSSRISRMSQDDDGLLTSIADRLSTLLSTHSIQFNLAALQEPDPAEGQVEGRRRRFRRMFPMMVAAFMLTAAFVVPLGFQFMAMIGGKALLLSKLAFFSAMYSGYRRVTADLDFHHHHPESFHHLGYHLRRTDNVPHHQAQPMQTNQYHQYVKAS
ncbi:Protein of unknown function (DUF1676) [Nesidiocoris tenuis]|uniref:Protein osiris 23 n=1 Tax=Nesidiocoris tenuis TaxID=355587 RepID=A0ABN7AUP1_9HEMI|nr:Protein of unknown function (DUF1676) [Nesidiocoris tenuis]